MGVLSSINDPLQQIGAKKGGGRIFEGGCILERQRYITHL